MRSDKNLKKNKDTRSLLFELPQNLVASVCIEWLNMVDLCHLDSAVCSKKWRSGFLNILKQESVVFNGFIYSETFKKEHLLDHDPSEIFSKGLWASPTIEPYIAPFDNPEYSAFHTGQRQCGEQSLPKTLRSKQKLEHKEKKKYLLERWQDKSLVRHSYSVPESVFCFPHHEAGLLYIHWLTVRNISVKHLLVSIDFRSERGKECFLNYLKSFQDRATNINSNRNRNTNKIIGKKRLRFADDDDKDEDFQYFAANMEDYFSPRKTLTDVFSEINTSDEIEMMDNLESEGCKSSSSSDGITNEITPIQCHWNAPTVGVTELRDNNTDMDVTIEYNKTINVSAIQMATSPDGLKESSATESFADAVLRSPGKVRSSNVCSRLRSICFRRCAGVTDDVIVAINPCKQLENLELLDCTMITDDGFMAMIEGWTSLKTLNVRESNRLSDPAIISVAERCPNLTLMDMHGCNRITDSALSSVAEHCKGIRDLFLSFGFSVSDYGLNDIVASCHDSLESISFELCNKVSDEGMVIFSSITCSAMRQLNLWGCTKLSDVCLVPIVKGCPNLTSLSVGLCVKMNDNAVKIVVQGCTLLQHLNLNYCNQVTDEALKDIAMYCHTLKSLGLSMCKRVTNVGMKLVLQSCRELENLNLECCDLISDDFLALAVVPLPVSAPATKEVEPTSVSESVGVVAIMKEQEEGVSSGTIHHPMLLQESISSSSSTLLMPQNSSCLDNDTSLISDGNSSTLKDSNNSSMVVSSNDNDIQSLSLLNGQCSSDVLLYSHVGGHFQSSANGQTNSCHNTQTALLSKLMQVNLSECKLLTDVSLRVLAKHSPNLRILNVLQCPNLTREGINILRQNCCDIQINHTI